MSERQTIQGRPYIFADDRTEDRFAVVRVSDYNVAGYILRTRQGWIIEDDPSKRVYKNKDEAAAPVYMRGRVYLQSYGMRENLLKNLNMAVIWVEGQWVSSIRQSEYPYDKVVADMSSPSLEEAKLNAVCRAHALLLEDPREMRAIFRSYAQEEWTDVKLSECVVRCDVLIRTSA